MIEKKCNILFFDEKDFFEASKFIVSQKVNSLDSFLFFPEQYKGEAFLDYYRAINMRTNHFHEIEIYMNVNDTITNDRVGVIGIYICPNNCVVYLTSIILADKLYLPNAIEQLEEQLREQSVKHIKVKFIVRDEDKIRIWEEMGFTKESIITGEAIDGSDFVLYGKKVL